MGAYMRDNGIAPELVLCSTSLRTRQTLDLAFPTADDDGLAVTFTREIYEAPPSALLHCIAMVDDDVRSLMIIGHNPGSQMLAMQLVATAQGDALERLSGKFPTAALARIVFQVDSWRGIEKAQGHLVQFIVPKQLA